MWERLALGSRGAEALATSPLCGGVQQKDCTLSFGSASDLVPSVGRLRRLLHDSIERIQSSCVAYFSLVLGA
jgi:hypothetical protein